ncbi:GD13464 [Drosophila simulans]|uniref:GD13464 n=1 Tax=Drosophila simulans TaxID=7240 RepID=B4QMG9_DROSI|nr:GD13464 [Drosophila simulans]
MSTTMTRRGQVATAPAEQASQEFPIIKKRFVSFPNYRAMPEDGPEYPHPPTAATTTMTQPGLDKVTEIDKIDEIDGGGGGGGGAGRTSISRDSTSSIDVDSVLPERTRLRRQRRVRSQDSVEEKPEDVIERLNKLKARISGALSEVKGVLKQYSTESEAESAAEQTQATPAGDQAAPVSFRFVKKVRRRSYFDEAEEEKEQAGEELVNASKDTKVHREQTPFARELLEDSAEREAQTNEKQQLNASKESKASEKDIRKEIEVSKKEEKKDIQESKELENQDGKLQKDQDNLDVKLPMERKESSEPLEEKLGKDVLKSPTNESRDPKISEVKGEEPKINGELPKTAEQVKQPEKSKTQAKIEFLAKVQSELKSKSVKDVTPKEQTTKEETIKGLSPKREATPKESEPKETAEVNKSNAVSEIKASEAVEVPLPDESPTSPPAPKTKKKVIVKVKNPRRASIAAVEPSKIKVEPAVEQSDVLITQRRPSDSEAISSIIDNKRLHWQLEGNGIDSRGEGDVDE